MYCSNQHTQGNHVTKLNAHSKMTTLVTGGTEVPTKSRAVFPTSLSLLGFYTYCSPQASLKRIAFTVDLSSLERDQFIV